MGWFGGKNHFFGNTYIFGGETCETRHTNEESDSIHELERIEDFVYLTHNLDSWWFLARF